MKKVFVVAFVVLVGVLLMLGCPDEKSVIKKVSLEQGKSVDLMLETLLPEKETMVIDQSRLLENSFPDGVSLKEGKITGVPDQNGTLTICFLWDEEESRYNVEFSFRSAEVAKLLDQMKEKLARTKDVQKYEEEAFIHFRLCNNEVLISLFVVEAEVLNYYASSFKKNGFETSSYLKDNPEKIEGLKNILALF